MSERDGASDGFIEAARESPVGTNDPNIVGDVGPTDIPPGPDPEGLIVTEDDPKGVEL